MSKEKSKEQLSKHKNIVLSKIDQYISSLISSNNLKRRGKADKLSYWFEDYIRFLEFEEKFSASNLKRYKRGDILKVHLGYNIGSEEGGLHYAVVVEKNNSIHNPVITIVPLTSLKPHKDPSNLRSGEIFLGNEIFLKCTGKFHKKYMQVKSEKEKLDNIFEEFKSSKKILRSALEDFDNRKQKLDLQLDFTKKMGTEITKMKYGSIALVNQITTISKIRIFDPKTTADILSGIRLSDENLDKIDNEILQRFIK